MQPDAPTDSLDPAPLSPQDELAHLRQLINETHDLAAQNNYLLHRMQYWGRVAFWAKVAIWTVVLIAPIFLYSYLAPFINILPGGAGGGSASSTSLFGFPSPVELLKAVHSGH